MTPQLDRTTLHNIGRFMRNMERPVDHTLPMPKRMEKALKALDGKLAIGHGWNPCRCSNNTGTSNCPIHRSGG